MPIRIDPTLQPNRIRLLIEAHLGKVGAGIVIVSAGLGVKVLSGEAQVVSEGRAIE